VKLLPVPKTPRQVKMGFSLFCGTPSQIKALGLGPTTHSTELNLVVNQTQNHIIDLVTFLRILFMFSLWHFCRFPIYLSTQKDIGQQLSWIMTHRERKRNRTGLVVNNHQIWPFDGLIFEAVLT